MYICILNWFQSLLKNNVITNYVLSIITKLKLCYNKTVYDYIKSHDHYFAMISENSQIPIAKIK